MQIAVTRADFTRTSVIVPSITRQSNLIPTKFLLSAPKEVFTYINTTFEGLGNPSKGGNRLIIAMKMTLKVLLFIILYTCGRGITFSYLTGHFYSCAHKPWRPQHTNMTTEVFLTSDLGT